MELGREEEEGGGKGQQERLRVHAVHVCRGRRVAGRIGGERRRGVVGGPGLDARPCMHAMHWRGTRGMPVNVGLH